MKINRYIKNPLIFGLSWSLAGLFYLYYGISSSILPFFVSGIVLGVGVQFYNDYKTRKVKPDAKESDFLPRQQAIITALCGFDEAMEVCLAAVKSLKNCKRNRFDRDLGLVTAKTGLNWNSSGTKIEFRLRTITENATEIEISTKCSTRTTLVDHGESLEIMESLKYYFFKENEAINRRRLSGSSGIPINVKVKEFEESRVPVG
jgi:hypothetical protein